MRKDEKKKIIIIFILYVSIGVFSVPVQADIIQDQSNIFMTIDYFEPLGQTFTADRDYFSPTFSVYFYDVNQNIDTGTLIFSLYEGIGFNSSPLAIYLFTLDSGFTGYYDFNFEGNLSAGSIYTFGIESSTKRWAVAVNQLELFPGFPIPGTTDYTGGHAIILDTPMDGYDLRFKVTGGNPPPVIPEPLSAILFTTGGSVLVISRYLRNKRKHHL